MGFWSEAGKFAKGAAESIEKKSNELHALQYRLEEKSSEELKEIIKSEGFFGSSREEKSIAMKILRSRGDA